MLLRSTSPASRSKITRDLQDAKHASSSAESAEEPRLRQAAHMVLLSLLRRLDMIRRNILAPVLVSLLYCTCLCRTKSPKSKFGKEESALKEPARTLGIALKDLLCMCSSFLLLYLVCFCLSLEWLKRCFPLNISEFAGQGQREEFGVLHCIGQVLFMRVLCLRSSSPSATFSKTRAEPEDIRASISSAGEALQEEIERQARGNHWD